MAPFMVDNIKGWTRATCVAFIILALTEIDISDPGQLAKLQPLQKVVDRAWLLPMHVALKSCGQHFLFLNPSFLLF